MIPQIRAVALSVVGRYTPEQLYSTKRDAIQNEIFEETQKNVESQHIQLNAVLVRDVTLPLAIKEAIERKLRQEQEALEYEFRIEKAKQEAECQRIDAEGKEHQEFCGYFFDDYPNYYATEQRSIFKFTCRCWTTSLLN